MSPLQVLATIVCFSGSCFILGFISSYLGVISKTHSLYHALRGLAAEDACGFNDIAAAAAISIVIQVIVCAIMVGLSWLF